MAADKPRDPGRQDPGPPGPGAGKVLDFAEVEPGHRALLPERGLVAGGDGLVSLAWRVSVDLDAASLTARRAAGPHQDLSEAPADRVNRSLTDTERAELEGAARDLLSGTPTPQAVFTIDSLGYLFVRDGDRVFRLTPTGPITEGREAAVHGLLYRLAWPEDG